MTMSFINGCAHVLNMGARAALGLLNALYRNRALTKATMAEYVMPALLGGEQVVEGSDGCERLMFGVLLDRTPMAPSSEADYTPERAREAVSFEAGMYLREILSAASGQDSHLPDAPFNGFSARAYGEVRSVLGRQGEAYLGLGKSRLLQLVPDEGRTRTQLIFEDDVRAQLEAAEAERLAEGEGWPDENPFAKPLPDWTDHWEPSNPFMEPWPWPAEPVPQESQPFGSASGQRRNGYGGLL